MRASSYGPLAVLAVVPLSPGWDESLVLPIVVWRPYITNVGVGFATLAYMLLSNFSLSSRYFFLG